MSLRQRLLAVGREKGKEVWQVQILTQLTCRNSWFPIIRQLITSLQNVGQSSNSSNGNGNGNGFNPSSFPCGSGYRDVGEGSSSTKAPLLGMKSGKHEKRSKDHVIAMRGLELEEHCRSAERGLRVDSGSDDTGSRVSPCSMQKEMNASGRRYSSQTVKKRWCRLVYGWLLLLMLVFALYCKQFGW